jgi:hypothetical protein
MKHYDYQRRIKSLHEKAVRRYGEGCASANGIFSAEEQAELAAMGLQAQAFFDYAEDLTKYGEPDFETALLIESVRRDYFLHVQQGQPSGVTIDPDQLPGKKEAVRGIEWLPRLIQKAKAKLRGELPDSLMFGCGGDRNFFQQHDLHPSEFLRAVWAYEEDDEALVAWLLERKSR